VDDLLLLRKNIMLPESNPTNKSFSVIHFMLDL